MHRRDFRDLLNKTSDAAVQTFEFVEEVTMISSLLGEVVGKTFPTEFSHVPFRNASSCMEEIGKKVGLQAKKASQCSANSVFVLRDAFDGSAWCQGHQHLSRKEPQGDFGRQTC